MKYVAYYRVSTRGQGSSGLGLEAQRSAVLKYAVGGEVIKEFTEIESGTRKGNKRRVELMRAIELCRLENATLVIAKLDRLSRNVSVVCSLMESGLNFVACDMPSANKFTIHVMAAMAEQEADYIASRTRDALAALKARGVKLGHPDLKGERARELGRKGALASAQARKRVWGESVVETAKMYLENCSYAEVGVKLAGLGIRASRGGVLSASQVWRLVNYL